MTIVIPSKNGQLFLPKLLKSLSLTNPTAKIVVVDTGTENTTFFNTLPYNFTLATLPSTKGVEIFEFMNQIDDDVICHINDSMIIKSPNFFVEMTTPQTDIRTWKTFNVMNNTSMETYNAMLEFLPQEFWTEEGMHGGIFSITKHALQLIEQDGFFDNYKFVIRTVHGFAVERLLPSYIVYLGGTASTVNKGTDYYYRHKTTIIESDTAIKYFASSILGHNRENIDNNPNVNSLISEIDTVILNIENNWRHNDNNNTM